MTTPPNTAAPLICRRFGGVAEGKRLADLACEGAEHGGRLWRGNQPGIWHADFTPAEDLRLLPVWLDRRQF